MESDLDSELTDFWQDFDNTLESPLRLSPPKTLKDFNTEALIEEIPIFELNETVKCLREAQQEEEKFARLDEQSTIRKYIEFSINHQKKKFQKDLEFQNYLTKKMKTQKYLQFVDQQIVSRYLIDNELMLTENRISSNQKKFVRETRKIEDIRIEKKELHKECELTKVKIAALFRAIRSMEENRAKKAKELADLERELDTLLIISKDKQGEAEEERKKSYAELRPELDTVLLEYENYKQMKLKELSDLESKCEKNSELIASLQLELKVAKKIIQNPAVTSKVVHETLKDYIEEFDGIDLKSSVPDTRNNSGVFRRRIYSNKAVSNLQNLTAESKKGLSPQASSKFKFYSRKPTLDSTKNIQANHPNFLSNQMIKIKKTLNKKKSLPSRN